MFLISGCGVLIGGALITYFASAIGIVNTGSGGGTLVGLAGGQKYVVSLGQEYLVCGGRELVEV